MKFTDTQIADLLQTLCIDLGFCLSAEKAIKIISNPPDTVDGFTYAVFLAEGVSPALADRKVYSAVHGAIAAAVETRGP